MKKPTFSNQVEIEFEAGLINFFRQAKNGSIRMIKLIINDKKELALDSHREVDANVFDWRQCYDKLVLNSIDSNSPCFLFYRLDEKTKSGCFNWLFILWSPSMVPNKQRTIYALAKPTVLNRFGHNAGFVREQLFATDFQEVSLNGYLSYTNTDAPFVLGEKKCVYLDENHNEYVFESEESFKLLPDLQLTIDSICLAKLDSFKNEQCDFLQMRIDLVERRILLNKAIDKLEPELLDKQIPAQLASFNLYRFKHCINNLELKSILFIYKIPDFGDNKEPVLYSGFKSELVKYLEKHVNICKCFDVTNENELNKNFFLKELNFFNLKQNKNSHQKDSLIVSNETNICTNELLIKNDGLLNENEEILDVNEKRIDKVKNDKFAFNENLIYMITCSIFILSIGLVGYKIFSNGASKK